MCLSCTILPNKNIDPLVKKYLRIFKYSEVLHFNLYNIQR